MPETKSLSEQVALLEMKHTEAMALLGEIVTTFMLDRNRDGLKKSDFGHAVLELANRWRERYIQIEDKT